MCNKTGRYVNILRTDENTYYNFLSFTKILIIGQDACSSTQLLNPATLGTLTARVGDPTPVIYTFPDVQDQVSLDNGDITGATYCGSRIYTLLNTGGASFLTLSGQEISIQTNSDSDEGEWTAEMKITLANSPLATPVIV